MERKPSKHARARSGAGAGAVLASFLRSTAASFSSSTTNFTARAGGVGGKSSFKNRNAFSGPMVSIVPPEARRRRGSKQAGGGSGFRTPEASSPKVSCIGQIKRSKSKRRTKAAARKAAPKPAPLVACGVDGGACPLPPRPPVGASRPKRSLVKRMLFRRSGSRSSSSKSSGTDHGFKARGSTVAAAPAPPAAGLGQMKRFTSGRAAFQDFDWTEEAEPRRGSDVDGYDSYEDEVFVAHSAPLVLGGGMVASEPRKEVNLWRRRPMSPPTPLQLPGKSK
ncbi:unnamed protein product [Alopecurus aequalis]